MLKKIVLIMLGLALGLSACGTPKSGNDALTKINLPTFYGRIKFAPDGSNPGKGMTMRQIQGGKYKVVWPREIAATDVVYPRMAPH